QALFDCVLGGELLVTLAAVNQMALHCRARLRHRANLDRLHDLLMLLLKGTELHAPLDRRFPLPDRPPGNDEAAEIFEKARELRIPRGVGYRTVKREVLIDRTLAALDCRLDGIEFFRDLLDLRR